MISNQEEGIIRVGIADMKIAKEDSLIRTSGLGSCVGVVLYSSTKKVAGMAHIMLPDSSLARGEAFNQAKYADTAIPELLLQLEKEGIRRQMLKAKLAGGAQMFQFNFGGDQMKIGPRNVAAIKIQLKENRIQLVAEDVGGSYGRTIEFNPITSVMHIRTASCGSHWI